MVPNRRIVMSFVFKTLPRQRSTDGKICSGGTWGRFFWCGLLSHSTEKVTINNSIKHIFYSNYIISSLSLYIYIYIIYIYIIVLLYNINISDPQAQVISFKSPFFWGPRGEENQIGGRVGERTPRNGGLDGHALSAAWHRMVDGWMVGSPTPLIFVQRALEKVENHQF